MDFNMYSDDELEEMISRAKIELERRAQQPMIQAAKELLEAIEKLKKVCFACNPWNDSPSFLQDDDGNIFNITDINAVIIPDLPKVTRGN